MLTPLPPLPHPGVVARCRCRTLELLPVAVAAAGDADALVRGRFGTNRVTMSCGDDASRVVKHHFALRIVHYALLIVSRAKCM